MQGHCSTRGAALLGRPGIDNQGCREGEIATYLPLEMRVLAEGRRGVGFEPRDAGGERCPLG